MFRQGDVLLVPVKGIPTNYKKLVTKGAIILALGEVTGHSHALTAATWLVDACADIAETRAFATGAMIDRPLYVEVVEDTTLTHQEHDTLAIPVGIYRVIRQREYSPEEIRNVAD